MRGFNEYNNGEKVVLASTIVAILSMFFKWVDIGFLSENGFQQQGFLFLVLYIFPVYKILSNKNLKGSITIILGVIASILGFIYVVSKDISVMGESFNAAGSGIYIFILASIGLVVGGVMINKEGANLSKEGKIVEKIEKETKKEMNNLSKDDIVEEVEIEKEVINKTDNKADK